MQVQLKYQVIAVLRELCWARGFHQNGICVPNLQMIHLTSVTQNKEVGFVEMQS